MLVIPRGDDVNLKFVIRDKHNELVVPQGASEITFTMKGCGVTVSTTDTWIEGHATWVHLTPEQTAETGHYKADIQFNLPAPWTPWIGEVHIIEDVTR